MFLQEMLVALRQVFELYIIVAIGFIADKTGWFPEKTARLCTDLLFYVITPAVILHAFLDIEYTPQTAKQLGLAMVLGVVLHLVAIGISTPFLRKGDLDRTAVLRFAAVYGNCGYMALPLANAVAGEEGVFYCSAVVMTFQIFSFTHGVWVMSKKGSFQWKKLILNPGTLPVLFSLPLFFAGLKLPDVIAVPITHISNMNTPLAMLIFGTYLAGTKFNKSVFSGKMLLTGALKLLILPGIMLVIMKFMGLVGVLPVSMIISASAPSANNTVIFSAKYGRDTGYAAQVVAMVSFVSVLTMPIMIAAAGLL